MARPIVILTKNLKTNFEQCPSPRLYDVLSEYYQGDVFLNTDIKGAIYLQVIEHVSCITKQCKIKYNKNIPLVVHHSEGDPTYFQNIDYIEKRGTFLHSSYNLEKGNYFNYWMYDYLLSRKKFQFDFTKKTDLPAKFLCLNGRPETHRYFAIQKLVDMNLFDKGLVSFLNRYDQFSNYYPYERFKNMYNGDSKFVDEMFTNKHEIQIDKTNDEIHRDDRSHSKYMYANTSVSLITETYADNTPGTFITEKSWKPIANMHLPIWVAQKNIVHSFKDMGFDVFEDIIDQSYDSIDNSTERWCNAIQSLKNLLSLIKDLERNKKQEILDRLEKNKQLMLNRQIKEKEVLEWT